MSGDRPETVTLAVFLHRRERAYELRDPKARAKAVKALALLREPRPESIRERETG